MTNPDALTRVESGPQMEVEFRQPESHYCGLVHFTHAPTRGSVYNRRRGASPSTCARCAQWETAGSDSPWIRAFESVLVRVRSRCRGLKLVWVPVGPRSRWRKTARVPTLPPPLPSAFRRPAIVGPIHISGLGAFAPSDSCAILNAAGSVSARRMPLVKNAVPNDVGSLDPRQSAPATSAADDTITALSSSLSGSSHAPA